MTKKLFKFFLILVCIVLLLNISATTKRGVNGIVSVIRIPLYIKAIEFIDRSFWYKRIAHEITKDSATDKEKVLAIFGWVTKNIKKPPKEFDVIDDHTLNIAIRRYGTSDQMADLFATLCVYSGIPAFREPKYVGKDKAIALSPAYVLLDNRWRVFDVYHNVFFLNETGEIASVKDIISDISIVKRKNINFRGIPYENFFIDLEPIDKKSISKEQKQIPLFRIGIGQHIVTP